MATARIDRRGEPQLHFQARLARDPPHRRDEGHVADVGRRVRLVTGPSAIVVRHEQAAVGNHGRRVVGRDAHS